MNLIFLKEKKFGLMHLIFKGKKNCLINVGSILGNVMQASNLMKKKKN